MKLIAILLLVALILGISGGIGAVCWPYTLNTWLEYADKPQTVTGWHGFLLGIIPVAGQLSIPGALVTWLVMLFLGE